MLNNQLPSIRIVILSGGSGSRLWPLSRKLFPKQFLKLFKKRSLFQETIVRNLDVSNQMTFIVNDAQYYLSMSQCEELNKAIDSEFIVEPVQRNTAPAIALACLGMKEEDIVLVLPSDHLIEENESYIEAVNQAVKFAEDDFLVTFGIKPRYPETGFGYIHIDGSDVIEFIEKPEIKKAKAFLTTGKHLWNSGMFCFKAGTYLKELKKYAPDIYKHSENAYKNSVDGYVSKEDMSLIPNNSIDYAIMEKSQKVKVVNCSFTWSDMGSFDALKEDVEKSNEYQVNFNSNTINIDSQNNFVIANKKVALIDVEDLIVIDTEDALLISKPGSTQKVKLVVEQLIESKSVLSESHITVNRPWGTYTILEDSPNYKIKKIMVKPGKRLSLQKHFHRSEHWTVVSGTAKVTIGTQVKTVIANESTYIPMGELHRLENPGKIELIIIETQVGEYLGEDDIARFDDDYKRENN